jgi:hypothetical protein
VKAAFSRSSFLRRRTPVILLNGETASFRALVTDVNLRGTMSGWDLAQIARERDPAFPIVYMTGTTAADWARFGVPIAFCSPSRLHRLSSLPLFPSFSTSTHSRFSDLVR